jgi:hypothetical protein
LDDAVGDATTLTRKLRLVAVTGDIATAFLHAVLGISDEGGLLYPGDNCSST